MAQIADCAVLETVIDEEEVEEVAIVPPWVITPGAVNRINYDELTKTKPKLDHALRMLGDVPVPVKTTVQEYAMEKANYRFKNLSEVIMIWVKEEAKLQMAQTARQMQLTATNSSSVIASFAQLMDRWVACRPCPTREDARIFWDICYGWFDKTVTWRVNMEKAIIKKWNIEFIDVPKEKKAQVTSCISKLVSEGKNKVYKYFHQKARHCHHGCYILGNMTPGERKMELAKGTRPKGITVRRVPGRYMDNYYKCKGFDLDAIFGKEEEEVGSVELDESSDDESSASEPKKKRAKRSDVNDKMQDLMDQMMRMKVSLIPDCCSFAPDCCSFAPDCCSFTPDCCSFAPDCCY